MAASPFSCLSLAPITLSQSDFFCSLRLSSSLSTCPVVLPDFSGSGRIQQISQVHIDPISYHAVASDPRYSKCLLASAQAFVLSSAAMKASTSITSVFTGLNTFTCVTAKYVPPPGFTEFVASLDARFGSARVANPYAGWIFTSRTLCASWRFPSHDSFVASALTQTHADVREKPVSWGRRFYSLALPAQGRNRLHKRSGFPIQGLN